MEIIAELFVGILQVVGELLLQIVLEILAELGLRALREPFRRPQDINPALAAVGYFLLGAGAGALSLFVFPASFVRTPGRRILNLVVTPICAGAVMAGIGAWRRRRDQDLIRLDRFMYGFVFAFGMALVRWLATTGGS